MRKFTPLFSLLLIGLLAACSGSGPSNLPAATVTPASRTSLPATPLAAAPPTAPLDKVRVEYGAPLSVIGNLPLELAQALDLFKAEGLDVALD